MRIGIITYHRSINYGSVLQAWATQTLLSVEGYDVEIIDYIPEKYDRIYKLFLPDNSLLCVAINFTRIPIAIFRKRQRQFFESFRSDHLILSKQEYTHQLNVQELESQYDCFICGSDQIWNVRAADCDDIFFLPNIKKRKIAFSVSINTTDFSESRCNQSLKDWIRNFHGISCRENTGARRIEQYLDNEIHVETLLDPTLVLKKEAYYGICSKRIIKGSYILLYKVWLGDDSYDSAKYLSKLFKLPVYALLMINGIYSAVKVAKNGIRILFRKTRPEDYLSLIRYADYVITDSFHGTAFSVIFEKQFFAINQKRQDGFKNDERIICLLSQLGIEERYLTVNELREKSGAINEIAYMSVTEKRMILANKTKRWLINAIED